ncbi:IclR family transcriptional regulator [Kerstersia gyiorum]|jgi:DNA-binding IclR family transcriptional regulator|uniref:IclR family transcriptional regulator n=1 Tax=Kerstersia gyiorum TaxID=206506 RepID=A0A4Q7MED5_9BURK|nr:IclR family transcriptional regulator [Kerstersia gyiorum]AZV92686.1 IclR family transcriptional regulator [Bordetella sp. J329]MCO7637881.1 IclR family transcriptional regulator [Pseudomonas sp. S 311-6]KAB0542316.1 IclR family transcriptional regulator [Kerstersia gyiorum]MCH4270931.1 IclR family transcriptional regulator [Kerstersia gyiorum]MCI1229903.1 IclR family transcriptional regulator [Kerstersia gyiorum]
MAGPASRTLHVLEYLTSHPEGLPLATIADTLQIPRSAAHRLLAELSDCGYVRQVRAHGDYVLTTKLASLGMSFLSNTGVQDIAQPILDRLAELSGEFVRLGVIDGESIAWLARAQGARTGLRYDPEMGMEARLSCSASGHAWLLTLPDERAIEMVARQGFGKREDYGPNAPQTVHELLACLEAARTRGFSMTTDTFMAGMAAMAAPIRRANQPATGTISIAGPASRMTPERMLELGPALLEAAAEMAASGGVSMLAGSSNRQAGHPVLN